MKQSLSFDKTLVSSLRTKVTVSKWYEATEAYDNKEYKTALLHIFDYVDDTIIKKYGNETATYFKIPHGSIVVEIEITATHFIVKAPFLSVGENQRVPLFRRIAEVNFSPLNLSQIRLKEDQLSFEYSTPLALCDPLKIYYVLEEICHNADDFDDEFIDLFDVKPLHEPLIEHYDEQTLNTAWEKFGAYLEEAQNYMSYFDQNRTGNFNWDIINITLKRIEYLLPPSGKLRTDIQAQVRELYSKEFSFQDVVQRGKAFLEKLQQKTKEEFLADMYLTESFIPTKSRCELDSVKQNWEKPFNTATKELQDKQFTGATLTLLLSFYDLYYYNNVPDDINDKAMRILQNAALQDWETAAQVLYKGMEAIVNEKPVAGGVKKKGFFSKLFK